MTPLDADERYLEVLLSQNEQRALEFKAATSQFDRDKAVSYCAALANEGGGHLVLGVSDAAPHDVVGSAAFSNPQGMELLVYEKLGISVTIRVIDYRGKRVLIFQIPSRRPGVPIEHDGRYLVRAGESLVSMTPHRIAEICAESDGTPISRVVVDDLSASDVDERIDLDTYFRLLPDNRPADLESQLGCLANRGLIRVNTAGISYAITTLGALFLARNLETFPALLWRRVRFVKYAGSDRVDAVFEKFETRGYGLAFEETLELIQSHIPVREVFRDGLRVVEPVYPPTALREFLANAMVHQDLHEEGVQLTVEVFSDRLEIRNPGEPLIEVSRFVDETRTRNPELAEIMRLAAICEIRGSGIDRAIMQIEDYLQPAPSFKRETAATAVILFADLQFADMALDERVWAAFLHCCVRYASSSRLTNTTLRERFGLGSDKTTAVSQTIAASIEVGLIKPDPRGGRSKRHAKYVPFFASH